MARTKTESVANAGHWTDKNAEALQSLYRQFREFTVKISHGKDTGQEQMRF